jgi:hypothetical protein
MLSHLTICILPREGPRDATAFCVTALLPSGDLGGEQCAVGQAPVKALAIKDTDLDFRHVEPAGVFRGVVEDDTAEQLLGRPDAEHGLETDTKAPGSIARRPGKGALHIPEKLALEQLRRDGRTIHRDERFIGADAVVMQRARDHFLAGAGFASDEERGIGDRRQADQFLHPAHTLAAADKSLAARLGRLFRRARPGPQPDR